MAFLETTDLIGSLAGMLTTLAFVPQAFKVIRTRSTQDLSLGMCLIFSAGLVMWLIYGLCIGSMPVILANAVTLVLSTIILRYKLKYG